MKQIFIAVFMVLSLTSNAQESKPFSSSPISVQALFKSTLQKINLEFKNGEKTNYIQQKEKNNSTDGYDAFNSTKLTTNNKIFFSNYTEWNSNYDITTNDVNLQLFFKFSDYTNSTYKNNLPSFFAKALEKCPIPSGMKANDVICFTLKFEIGIGVTSEYIGKATYILFSSKKLYDESCEADEIDEDEVKEYRKKLTQIL